MAAATGAAAPRSTPDDATLSTGERRITIALLAAVFAVHFLDRQLLAILIPPIKSELGLSDTALGFLSGFAFTLFFSTVGLLIARLADRARPCTDVNLVGAGIGPFAVGAIGDALTASAAVAALCAAGHTAAVPVERFPLLARSADAGAGIAGVIAVTAGACVTLR